MARMGQLFSQVGRNVTVFHNTDTETGEKVAEENVALNYCGCSSVNRGQELKG